MDTIVRYIEGTKRCILTATNTQTRMAFAACYTNHGSVSAASFLRCASLALPDFLKAIQTDNDSEFAFHFESACRSLNLVHYHTYPKSPKLNATSKGLSRFK